MDHRRSPARQARQALGWGLLLFLGTQIGFIAVVDLWHRELYDPEYMARLATLRSRQTEAPDRPLLLVVGSSRTMLAFEPECLPKLPGPDGRCPLLFNFSHLGAGPVMNLLQVRRLLADGIHPDWLVVELMPGFVAHEGRQFLISFSAPCDFFFLRRYVPWWQILGNYLDNRIRNGPKFPLDLLPRLFPAWAGTKGSRDYTCLGPLGGARTVPEEVSSEESAQQTRVAHAQYASHLQHFAVHPTADRALRDLLDLCRDERIGIVLLRTPEGSLFRSWYDPKAGSVLERFCADLRQDYGVQVIDGTTWLEDGDFFDSHHVLRRGAEKFTHRFAKEVVLPLLERRQGVGAVPVTTNVN